MQVSFNYCPTAFDLDLLVYTEMLCKDAVDLNALKEDVFHLAQSKICTTRNLGLSNLVSADYKIKYDNEIQLAEDEEMIDFGSEPYVEDYRIQTSEERCFIEDIDILQRELEKMEAELGLKGLVSEEVDLDNLSNSEDSSQQTKFCSSAESDSDLAEDKVEEVEEKAEDENSGASEVDLTTEDDESNYANNPMISSSEIEDDTEIKTPEELLEEAKKEHGISDDDEIPDFSALCSDFMSDNADILSNFDNADSEDENEQGTPEQEQEDGQEQGTNDFEDEYLDNDILDSIEVIEETEEDSEESSFDFDTSYDEDEDTDFESSDLANSREDDEDDVDFGSDSDDEDSDFDDFSGFSEEDFEDEEQGISSEDENDDDEDISFGSEESDESEDDSEDEDSFDFGSDEGDSGEDNEDDYDFSESDDEDDYDFSEPDDNDDDDIPSEGQDSEPTEESVVYEDEYLDSDIYANIKILKRVKKKQGVSESASVTDKRQSSKSKKSSSTLGVGTKKAKDSVNVNDSSKSSGSLSKASKEALKSSPSSEKVVEQPKKSEFGSRDEEPKDLRSFLRKHPHCEMSVIYKYFTKKEVQNALLTGKVVKKGTQLHI